MSTNNSEYTVLIVDDNPDNLNLLVQQLLGKGFQLMVAESGTSALERVSFRQPDIILLDILIADMDGFEICRQLKANPDYAQIPVIFLTALTDSVDKAKGFKVGGVDYITKPLDINEVVLRVRTHLQLNQLRAELSQSNSALEARVSERTNALEVEIARREESEQERSALLEVVRSQGEHLQQLTTNLLDLQLRQRSLLAQELDEQVSQNLELMALEITTLKSLLTNSDAQSHLHIIDKLTQQIHNFVQDVEKSLQRSSPETDVITTNPLLNLSAREREVLHLIVNGHNTEKIANMLHVSNSTVRTYRYRIHQKLGVGDQAGLVQFAMKYKLIEPNFS